MTLVLSSKQNSSNTGPKDFKVQYKISEGGTWTDVTGAAITVADNFTTGVLNAISLPSSCDNQTDVYLRWIMTSNTSVNNSTVASGGTSRIDDILIFARAPTGVVEIGVPSKFDLSQNYPNPFNPSTKINFNLPADCKVSLIIYDVTGREAAKILNNEFRSAGYYTAEFNAFNFASGVYFYSLSAGNFRITKRALLVK